MFKDKHMIPSTLAHSINENDVNGARAFFVVQINNERKKAQFELSKWSEVAEHEFNQQQIDFFQHDNGKIQLPSEKTLWTKELWSEFRVELEYNFSKFKLYSILEIMTYLRSQGHEDFKPKIAGPVASGQLPSTNRELNDNVKDTTSYPRSSITGAVIGGISGKFIGMAVTGVVAGAAIGFAYAYYKNKRN